MKVIALNGSPHGDRGTGLGINLMKNVLEKEGVSVEVVHVGDQLIRGCVDCRKCRELKRCAIDGDILNETRDKIDEADGIILGSPVYYSGIAGTFKSFLDRLFFTGVNLRYKAAATVVSVRRSGGLPAFHQLNNYLNLAGAIITPGVYWNVIHGRSADEISKDEEGIHIMETQARNMAWLIKVLAAGKKEIPLPEHPKRAFTNFIR
ncbi:MAG: flavodoxin family protein [Treponema sp.]|nr:flavodoxin family protein [Treponema sp.]